MNLTSTRRKECGNRKRMTGSGSKAAAAAPEMPALITGRFWRGVEMQLFTIKQAALRLAVSVEFLKRLQRQGQLRIVRLVRAVRISEQELQRLSVEGLKSEGL